MTSSLRLVQVAVSGPLRRTFTYHLPPDMPEPIPGQRLLVEFGRKRTLGFFLGDVSETEVIQTKPVLQLLDPTSFFPPDLFRLALWIADYYFANPADCLVASLPPGLRGLGQAGVKRQLTGYRVGDTAAWNDFFARRRFKPEPFEGTMSREELGAAGWTDHYLREATKQGLLDPVYDEVADSILDFVQPREKVGELVPNREQQTAIDNLTASLSSGFGVNLLHGVTGSGKTLVYCRTVQEVLKREKSVLVLTPEIALSGTALAYFRGFFGDEVTVIHSAMTDRERLESWRGIREGRYRVVVGPRSALFALLDNLGLIVVDEEHDGSYKQSDPAPRFHGRDAAIMRAKLNDIPILLGSASPSVESFHHASTGRYNLLTLNERPEGATLPTVTLVDMRTQKLRGDTPYLSFMLKREIDERLERGEQAILFLNRRGYSPQLKCADCGHVPACPECEIKLTYHKTGRRLWCHYCGHMLHQYNECEKCGSNRFLYPGTGTQKVEEHVARLFKHGKVLRFDSDTASGRRSAHQLLREFSGGEHNLLLGTQMVTKGLDLPGVTLVGVLSADLGLDLPDFRAGERTFARLLQVAGRSGRGERPGEVFIQTYYPESEVIQDAAGQDYHTFFARELESRRQLSFPPFSRLVRFVISAIDRRLLEEVTLDFAGDLRDRIGRGRLAVDLLGPAPCPIALLRGRARRHLIARTSRPVGLVRLLTAWEGEKARFGLPAKVRITVDVDPDDMM